MYFAEHCGLSPASVLSNPDLPFGLIVSSGCDYYAPLQFPEPATLGLRIARSGGSSVHLEVGFFAGDKEELSKDEEAKAVAVCTLVFVSQQDRRPIKLEETNGVLRDGLNTIYTGQMESSEQARAKL